MTDDDSSFVDDDRFQRFVRTAQSTLSSEHIHPDIKKEVRRHLKYMVMMSDVVRGRNGYDKEDLILEMMDHAFWIGRYAPASLIASFVEASNQSLRAKRRVEKARSRPEDGWRLVAREAATRLAAGNTRYSANGLAEAIISEWGQRKPPHPSSKTLAKFVSGMAAEPGCRFVLRIDGRKK